MPTLEISNGRFEYLEQGNGEPVILLHGSGSSSAQWRALTEQLSARYRVCAPDLYGYGASADWPGRRAFHLEHEAEIVLALLARVGAPAHLVAHSYGGAVALHVARAHADALRSLTLIEPAAFHLLREAEPQAAAGLAAVAESMVRAVAGGEYLAGFGRFVDYWNGAGAWAAIPADKQGAMAVRLPKVVLDFHATFNEPTRLDDFRAMDVPTLLVEGTRSPQPTRRICELLACTLPVAHLVSVEGAGHMSPITHRDQVNAIVFAQLDLMATHRTRRAVTEDLSGRIMASIDRTAA